MGTSFREDCAGVVEKAGEGVTDFQADAEVPGVIPKVLSAYMGDTQSIVISNSDYRNPTFCCILL